MMRRHVLLVATALAASLTLTACWGGPAPHHAASAPRTASAAPVNPATVVDGMHYVQLFDTVDAVLTRLQTALAAGTGLPSTVELHDATSALRQFVAQAPRLPTAGKGRVALEHLKAASSTLAAQLTAITAKGSPSGASRSSLTAALTAFRSASAGAREAVGLHPAR
jgi:hypothetical protein